MVSSGAQPAGKPKLRVTVTQINASQLEDDWASLRSHAQAEASDLVLLPEMCFAPWFCAAPVADEGLWQDSVSAHDRWLARLAELGAGIVVGTAPRCIGERRHNVAYIWSAIKGLRWDHAKTYLPNDDGYWEAAWYDRAPMDFRAAQVGSLTLGLMICTELWFMQHARDYGKSGIHLLLNPRSTPRHTNDKWLAGGRAAAVISGAYCLSSNHAGQVDGLELGGCGWIIDPDGQALATTSDEKPFVTLEIDMPRADAAKHTYPRYVDDSPL